MNRLLIGTGIAAALSLAATGNAQRAEAPIPALPPGPPSAAQPVPYTPPPAAVAAPAPRIEMPSLPAAAAQQGATQRPEPMPPRPRARAKHRAPVSHVDRAAADAFTRQLNRRELDSLEPGGGPPQPDASPPPGRELYPPQ